ncbi:MAG: twin-arginine translocase TatA/TatE family subunit [Chloroflexota bacterium]
MPEFMIIAVVALVVLGPDRLPEVMRKVGQLYRQVRELANQYTSEAQRMFDEGMREVEDVSSTINTAWEDAASTDAQSNAPPPKLRQLPPPLQAPTSVADAGPWMLAAGHSDSATDLEAQPAAYPHSPFALPRQMGTDTIVDGLGRFGGPPLLGPGPADEALASADAIAADLPDLPEGPDISEGVESPPSVTALPPAPVAPAAALRDGVDGASTSPLGATAAPSAPSTNGATTAAPTDSTREQTIIDLYLQGGITWQRAAEFLEMSPAEFLDRLERVRRARASS